MFNKIREIMRAGRTGADAVEILSRTYNLPLTDEVRHMMSLRVEYGSADCFNAHELAVLVLADFFKEYSHLPAGKGAIRDSIRIAKGAERRGLISYDVVLKKLLDVAEERFGIDHTKIDAL